MSEILEKNNHSDVTSVNVPAMQIRWWNASMYEFKFPDGTTVLSDPFLPNKEINPEWARWDCGIYADALDNKIDYMILTHPHGDHIGTLNEIFDRFHPVLLCYEAFAYVLAKSLDIPFTSIIPMGYDQTLDFDSFKMTTRMCRHYPTPAGMKMPERPVNQYTVPGEYGSLFNTDHVFTTPNNFRVAIDAGLNEPNEENDMIPSGLNVLIRQCGTTIKRKQPELLAKQFMATGASVLFPLHHEKCYEDDDLNAFVADVNRICDEHGYYGRMILPERAKWYTLSVGASLAEE